MRKSAILLTTLILAGSLLLSACSSGGGNNTAAGSESSNVAANTSAENSAVTDDQPIAASDMSKLPALAQKRTDTIIVGLKNPSGAFTPYFHQSGYDGNVSSLLYSRLVTQDEQGLPVPELAESWDVSDDQLTYTFHLRKDLKFSDGSPMTAEDVAFTWTLLYDKAYDGDSIITAIGIKGGQDYKEGKATSIEGIQVSDPLTVSVTLEKPIATAPITLGGEVLSKAYYGKDYKFGDLEYIRKLHENPVGNGPYKLEKFIPGQEVRFVANEYFYLGKPKTEHFIYKTSEGDTWQYLETGEVDYGSFTATEDNLKKLKNMGYLNIVPYTPSVYGYLGVNLQHETYADKKVRQAITYGLDRQSIYVEANQGAGQVANIPTAPISWSYTEEGINPYEYDPEKAKQLLEEAGWTVGSDGIREKDGKKLTLHFLGSKSPSTDIFIALATEGFKEIGVDFQPEVFADFNALVDKYESGDYDLVSFSTPILSDPSDGVQQFINGEVKGYDNPKVKELYFDALSTSDTEQRKKYYAEMYKILNDELPIIFTSYRKSYYAYNGRLDGVVNNPFAGFQDVNNWSLK
ncbi:ABC transporter substrate-binding protein [Paenibacillus aceti]|uniref:ABC transporter substrate-binding protein n=1 Tax=Paenibacillus aceti TaxID=1820010 RepID=A0ABQ1VTZ8_9BACL|nr:ABC transporter substrate-binding protein [Paenibacillus aceti]GGF94924.1 ABC transporter substrate-binding protein [Paenibacillus aceti]